MSRQVRRLPLIVIAIAVVLGVGLVVAPAGLNVVGAAGPNGPTPDQVVHAAWRNIQKSGEYRFATQLEQITWPAPKLTNVGRSSQREILNIEGQANLPQRTLEVSLSQAGKPDPLSGVTSDNVDIKITGSSAQGRVGDGAWEPIENFSGSFAPGNDLAAYLVGATNIQEASADPLWPASVKHYTFDLDTVAFSKYIGDQLEQQLSEAGQLPPGLHLDTANLYRDAQGNGEILISADELPTQLQVHLAFPQQASGERVEINVVTTFTNFNRQNLLAAAPVTLGATLLDSWRNFAIDHGLPRTARDWTSLLTLLALTTAVAGVLVYLLKRSDSRRVRAILTGLVIFSMIVPPVLNSQQAYAYSQNQAAKEAVAAQDQADRQAVQQAVDAALKPDWDSTQNPVQVAAARYATLLADLQAPASNLQAPIDNSALHSATTAATTTGDCVEDKADIDNDGLNGTQECLLGSDPTKPDTDGDGLTDKEELLLGTDPLNIDTDGDGLTDYEEVVGTQTKDGSIRYTDPNNPDTNGDGLMDGVECPERAITYNADGAPIYPITSTIRADFNPCRDTNNNGVPDVFDDDNDGDGVIDSVDLSPNASSGPYSTATPFKFTLANLATQSGTQSYPLVMEVQMRPITATHLGFAQAVWNWPTGDTQGNVQETQDKTFADFMDPADAIRTPSASNGDMRITPMLELKMGGANLPVPMVTASASYALAENGITGTLVLANNLSGSTPIATVTASAVLSNTGPYTLTIETTSCSTPITQTNPVITVTNFTGSAQSITGNYLTALADSAHVVRLSTANATTCQTMVDLPNAGQNGKMVDPSFYAPYGIAARDKSNTDTTLLAYVPLNLTDDKAGGHAAFTARLPFRPDNASAWGNASEIRLVWLVQMLNASGGVDVIKTYADDWTLSGLMVSEDRGLKVGVIYENPATDDNQNNDSHLWALANSLDKTFSNGRSDITIDEINRRFNPALNESVTLSQTWGISKTAFSVYTATYASQNDLAQIPMTVTPQLLTNFNNQGAQAPLLLYLQELKSRDMALGDTEAVSATNGVLNISFASAVTTTVRGLSWSPYRKVNNQWEAFPINQYWDQLKLEIAPAIEADTGEEDADAETALQSYFVSLQKGVYRTLVGQSADFGSPPPLDDALLQEWQAGTFNEPFGSIAEEMTSMLVERNATAAKYAKALLGDVSPKSPQFKQLRNFANKLDGRLTQFESHFSEKWKSRFGKGLTTAQFASALAVGIASQFDNRTARKVAAGFTIAQSVFETVGNLKEAYDQLATIRGYSTGAIKELGGEGKAALKNGLKNLVKAERAAKAGAVVGFVVTASVATAVFITNIVTSNTKFASLAFNAALADLTAELIVAGIMLALTLAVPVGTIIAAAIGAIDGAIAGACAIVDVAKDLNQAAKKKWSETSPVGKRLCGGISGLLGAVIKMSIYNQRSLIGNMASPTRLQVSNLVPALIDPERDQGFTVGAQMRVSLAVTNTILRSTYLKNDNGDSCAGFKTNANGDVITNTVTGQPVCLSEWDYAKENDLIPLPFDPLSVAYFWQYNDSNAKQANFVYRVQAEQKDFHKGLDLGPAYSWQQVTGSNGQVVPRKFAMSTAVAGVVALTTPGVNQPLQTYLSEGYAVPVQECFIIPLIWTPVCYIRADRSTKHLPLGDGLMFDVFPKTFDEFIAAAARDGGSAPAWTQSGETTFDRQKDFDGDGLLNKADGGNDPNDASWDTDGDGLPDNVELAIGTDPTKADTDGDGLDDHFEVLHGTDPTKADTDGDGLRDNDELAGWPILIDSRTVWVYSDPNTADADMDGLSDIQEKIYGFNPAAPNNANVLTFESQLNEIGTPSMLLRFEETAGAQTFSDWSGYGRAATCALNACPTAGVLGKYTNGVMFNGSTSILTSTLPDNLSGDSSFTVAFWLKYQSMPSRAWVMDLGTRNYLQAAHWLIEANGQADFGFWSGTQNNVSLSPYLGQWVHVATVYDASAKTLKTYLNGVQADSDTVTSTPNLQSTGGFRLGQPLGGESYFKGGLDEVALFPTALTQTQVQAVMNAEYNVNDQVVLPQTGAPELTYSNTIRNELNARVMQGLFQNELPPAISGAAAQSFVLQPEQSQMLSGQLDLADAITSGAYSVTQAALATVVDWTKLSGGANLWLDFNEASAPFYDTSGSIPQRNGTCTNCPTTGRDGVRGQAVSFNGTGNAVTVQNAPNLANQSFSISFWAKLADVTATPDQWVVSGGHSSSNGDLLHVGFRYDGQFECGFAIDRLNVPWTRDTNWHQWICTYNASSKEQTVYRDGALVGSRTASANYQDSGPLFIGSDLGYPGFFKGQLDDLRIFPRTLTPQEAGELYLRPIVQYRFDETGQVAGTDLSGNNNAASCSGVTCPGRLAGQADFKDSKYFTTTNNIDLTGGQFTLQFRVKRQKPGCYVGPVPCADFYEPDYYHGTVEAIPQVDGLFSVSDLYVEQEGKTLKFGIGTTDRSKWYVATGVLNYPVTLVYDKGKVTLYRGTDQYGPTVLAPFARTAPSAVAPLYIGRSASRTEKFIGQMDNVTLYGRALSAEEVLASIKNLSTYLYLPLDELPNATVFRNLPTVSTSNPEPRDSPGFSSASCAGSACPLTGVDGRRGYAAQFDGNDVVTWRGSVPMTNYDASLWFRTAQKNGMMYALTDDAGNTYDRLLYLDTSGNVCAYLKNLAKSETICTSGVNYADNQWHFVDHQVEYTKYEPQRLYVDDIKAVKASGTLSTGLNSVTQVRLGQGLNSVGNFVGLLDDVRVIDYNSTNPSPLNDAPTFLLHLNEAPGSTAFTNVGTGGNPICEGACPQAGVKGPVSLAAQFDVTRSLMFTPTSDLFAYTVAFWARRDRMDQADVLYDPKSPSFNPHVGFDANGHFTCGNYGDTTASDDAFADTQWAHWACVIEGYQTTGDAHIKLYRNGSLIKTTSRPGLSVGDPTFEHLRIGQFNGALDEVTLYPRTLTDVELYRLYLSQRSTVEERQAFAITVDRNPPTSTLRSTTLYRPLRDAVLDVSAVDQQSAVALVELGVKQPGDTTFSFTAAPACRDAEIGVAWCPTFAPTGEGRYDVQTRATDVVGNRETPGTTTTFYVDGTPPFIGSTTVITDALFTPDNRRLTFPFTFSDPAIPGGPSTGSGVMVTQTATFALQDLTGATVAGDLSFANLGSNNWNLYYDLPGAITPGTYTVTVSIEDAVGNRSTAYARRIRIDSALPAVSLDAAGLAPTTTVAISTTGLLQGTIDVYQTPPGSLVWLPFEEAAGAATFQQNFALRHPASQSSTASGQGAALAVDGNTNGTAASTNNELNPWWQVDLSDLQLINSVVISAPATLNNVNIFLSDRPFTSTTPADVQNADYIWRASLASLGTGGVTINRSDFTRPGSTITTTLLARYLRIQLGITGTLALNEVQVNNIGGSCATCPALGQSGVRGNAAAFNGVNNFISMSRPVQDDFTIAFWLKSTQTSGSDTDWWQGSGLVDGESPGVANDFGVSLGNGKVLFGVGNPDVTIKSEPVADGAWHHVAAVREKFTGAMRLYVDGVLVSSGTGSVNSLTAPANLRVGSLQTNKNFFAGMLDEVLVYDRPLTANEIALLARYKVSGVKGVDVAFTPIDGGSPFYNEQPLSGTVLQLPVDDTPPQTGTVTFKNIAGTNLSVTCTSCPIAGQSGPRGRAISFDGTTQALEATLPTSMAGDKSFTVAFWTKYLTTTNRAWLMDFGQQTTQQAVHWLINPDGQTQFGFWAGTQNQPNLRAYTGQWVHLATVYDAGDKTLKTYLNGAEADSDSVSGIPNLQPSGGLRLGKPIGGESYYRGGLDDVRLFDHPLSATEVRALYLGSNPVLALNFESENLADASDWMRNVTTVGHPRPTSGKVGGSALSFDGVQDALAVTRPVQDDFTIAFWFSSTQTTGGAGYWWQGNGLVDGEVTGVADDFGVSLGGGKVLFGVGNPDVSITSGPVADGTWHHVAAVREKNTGAIRLYIDGDLVGSNTGNTNRLMAPADLSIGSLQSGKQFFAGTLDDVQIYPRVLTAEEIKVLTFKGWRPATMAQSGTDVGFSTWTYALPVGLEGNYAIDLRATNQANQTRYLPAQWQGGLDTTAPRATLSAGSGSRVLTARDFNLNKDSLNCSPGGPIATSNYQSPWYVALTSVTRPFSLTASPCNYDSSQLPTTRLICDYANNCATGSSATPGLPSAPATVGSAASLYTSVLTPTAHTTLLTINPITVAGFASADPDYVQAITLTVNGAEVGTQVFVPGTVTSTLFGIPWAPTNDGAYLLEATALDSTGAMATAAPVLVYVDTHVPQADFGALTITATAYSNGFINFSGPLTETNPTSLQLQVGNTVIDAQANGATWLAPWPVDISALPDGVTYPLVLTVTDVANNVVTRTANALVDVLSPAPVTLRVTADGAPIPIGGTLPSVTSTLLLTWTPSSDGSGIGNYSAGWNVFITDTVNAHMQAVAPAATLQGSLNLGEGQKATAILNTTDALGNVNAQTVGPFYAESALTPDYVSTTPDPTTGAVYRGWANLGCSLVGTDDRILDHVDPKSTLNTAQNLYTTWNADSLRLLWTGADWNTDGDLFIYLDTQMGGSDRAYDPYAQRETIVLLPTDGGLPIQSNAPLAAKGEGLSPLAQRWQAQHQLTRPLMAEAATARPFRADYVVWVKSQSEVALLKWDEATHTWQTVDEPIGYGYHLEDNVQYTDVQVPFSVIGISDPSTSPLSLLAFASEDDMLRIWATIPNNNPANSPRLRDFTKTQVGRPFVMLNTLAWNKVADGQCPNGTLAGAVPNGPVAAQASTPPYTNATLDIGLNSDPAALTYRLLGDGLFEIMGQLAQFSGNANFTAAQAEMCAANPTAPECARTNSPLAAAKATASTDYPLKSQVEPNLPGKSARPALKSNAPTAQPEFDASLSLSDQFNTVFPPVGNGQAVTYTFHLTNRGTTTATQIIIDALTYGPLRLPAGTPHSDANGQFYSLVQNIGDLAPGAETTVNIAGQIDYSFDAGNLGAGLANLDVVVYDSRGTAFSNQLDWAFITYQLDQSGPLTILQPDNLLIHTGTNSITGRVFDASSVPNVTLEVRDPIGSITTVNCARPDPTSVAWSCDWDAGAANNGDTFSVRARATDAYGQSGDWTHWINFTVDHVVPAAAFDATTNANLSDGLIGLNEATLSGEITDNRSGSAVDACYLNSANEEICQQIPAAAEGQPQTTFTDDDIPAQPLPLGAGQGCYTGNEIYRFITVSDTFTIANVQVGLNISHPYRYDVSAWLQSPSGTWTPLLWNAAPQTQNVNVLLSDAAPLDYAADRSNHDASGPYYDRSLRPAGPLSVFRGEPAQGQWLLMLCDYYPPQDDGTYNRAQLIFTADTLPQNVAAHWSYRYDFTGDVDHAGPITLHFYGVDSVGNRSTTPLTTTFYVDNVAPVITVTQVITTMVYTIDAAGLFTGRVSDGSAVTALFADVQSPSGALYNAPIAVTNGAWSFATTLDEPGRYAFHINAIDAAGNVSQSGEYFIAVGQPAVYPIYLPLLLRNKTAAQPAVYPIYLPLLLRNKTAAQQSVSEELPTETPVPTATVEPTPTATKASAIEGNSTPTPVDTPTLEITPASTGTLAPDGSLEIKPPESAPPPPIAPVTSYHLYDLWAGELLNSPHA